MSTADLGSVRLHYELSGNAGRDVLVLVNSLGSSLHMWDKVVPKFEAEYSLVRFDIRGHGKTPGSPGPYSIEQLAVDMISLLDEIGVEQAHICGISLGGLIAQWTSLHAPKRVRKMILANTAARIGTRKMWEDRIAAVERSGMNQLATATIDRWFTPVYRNRHPAEMRFIEEMIASTSPESYIACCEALRDADMTSSIGSVGLPALVITGTSDSATPPADGLSLKSLLPNSAYVDLNASHISPWEAHDEFANAVLAFLSEGDSRNG